MHLRLTPSRMLDLWMLHSGYSPSFTDAAFRRNDGIDTSAIHLSEMKQWYRRLLLEAPASCLVADDLSKSIILTPASDGSVVIDLPQSVVRIVSVRLDSWLTSARIVTSPTHPAAMRQLHPYTRATPSRPVAIFHDNRSAPFILPPLRANRSGLCSVLVTTKMNTVSTTPPLQPFIPANSDCQTFIVYTDKKCSPPIPASSKRRSVRGSAMPHYGQRGADLCATRMATSGAT